MADKTTTGNEVRDDRQLPLRRIAGVAGLLVFLGIAGYLAWRQHSFEGGSVTIGDASVRVEVAATPFARERGLSGRPGLGPDEGMLFLFERPDTYAFWMKDMRFPIDILWIKDGVLVDITTDAPPPAEGEQPPLFFPRVPVDQVLEVSAGFARKHGLRTGMEVAVRVDSREKAR